jgi:predicted NAD-dependent protein-ADP-ribosyltransferase YbiA (DUF1768 family)
MTNHGHDNDNGDRQNVAPAHSPHLAAGLARRVSRKQQRQYDNGERQSGARPAAVHKRQRQR